MSKFMLNVEHTLSPQGIAKTLSIKTKSGITATFLQQTREISPEAEVII